jgi:hypothetical protein
VNAKLRLAAKAAVVGSLAVAERVRPPRATRRDDVPSSGAKLTRAWLSDALCHGVPDAEVVSFARSGGSSGTSERVGLRVTYNAAGTAAGLPTEVYTKSTASFRQRMALGGAGILSGEPRFYTGLRDKTEIEAPRGYWGAVDDRSWRSIVLIEDIAATKGAEFLPPTTGFTRAQMTDLVQNLARLHGPYWNSPELASLHTPAEYNARTNDMLNFSRRAAVGMERARAVIPPALLGQADRLHRATIRAMDVATHQMPRTLLHGDCHAGQIYRTRDGAMGIADWQTVMQGGWSFDYSYLVNTGLEPADRRAWQDDLLRKYLEELSHHGGPEIGFADAMLAYRQQSFWPYTAWAFTIGRAFYHPQMQPVPTCLALVHRTATAIDDLDAFAAVGL